jgi:2-methylisocitrate lyase-like PEP mutase family enzyme
MAIDSPDPASYLIYQVIDRFATFEPFQSLATQNECPRPQENDLNQNEKAKSFAKLHERGNPIVLFNAWDAGSAKTVLEAGAQAVATSSWAMAVAQGYPDGENIPLMLLEKLVGRIVASVDAPVTVDFEGGYSEDDNELTVSVSRLLDLGVIGINFEDRVVKGKGLYSAKRQAERIAIIRKVAERKGVALFINARTDLFLGRGGAPSDEVPYAIERAAIYAAAGASGFFIPGLADDALIGRIADAVTIPVNVMMMDGVSPVNELAKLGVARVSYGPTPYIEAAAALTASAQKIFQKGFLSAQAAVR